MDCRRTSRPKRTRAGFCGGVCREHIVDQYNRLAADPFIMAATYRESCLNVPPQRRARQTALHGMLRDRCKRFGMVGTPEYLLSARACRMDRFVSPPHQAPSMQRHGYD